MAEAAVDMSSMKYFCHQCSQETDSVLSDFTCPRCLSGFVEEVSNEDNDPTNQENDDNMDSGTQMADLLDNLYGPHSGSRPQADTNGSNSTSGRQPSDRSDGSANSFRRQRNVSYPPRAETRYFQLNINPRNSGANGIENIQSLEGLFQQILNNVASGQLSGRGGGANAGAQGLINIDFPLPLFQVLHGNPGDYAWGDGGLNEIISQLLNQLDGSGPPPMAKEDIDKVPFVTINEEQVQKNLQCTVCMEDFKFAEKVRLLDCSHCYHNECIVPWLQMHATCPVCRKELTTTRTPNRETHSSSDPNGTQRPGSQSVRSETTDSNTSTQSSNTAYEWTDDYD